MRVFENHLKVESFNLKLKNLPPTIRFNLGKDFADLRVDLPGFFIDMKKSSSTLLHKFHPIIGDPQNFSELRKCLDKRFVFTLVSVLRWQAVD